VIDPRRQANPPVRPRLEGGRRLREGPRTSRPGAPLLSVITVVLNGERHLEKTVRSVLEQSFGDVEYIVIDGGSTDGTVDILRRYEERLDYWVSEPDRGIYDAMNKGIGLSGGDLVGILNSDDRYLPGALDAVAAEYREGGNRKAVIAGPWKVLFRDRELGTLVPSLKFHDLRICHQAMFVPRRAYEEFGPYDTGYRYSADLDMALRLYRGGCEFRFVEQPIAAYNTFGASGRHFLRTSREQSRIIGKFLDRRSRFLFQLFRARSQILILGFLAVEKILGEDLAGRLAAGYFRRKGKSGR